MDNNNQNYHQQYYRKNIQKFYNYNHNRPSKKNIFFGVEINGITYCFEKKNLIPIKKIYKKDIEKNESFQIVNI